MEKSNLKKQRNKKEQTVLLGVTGGIACYKACELVRMLRKKEYSVKCVMTMNAARFVTPLTFETLTGHKVALDLFELPEERNPEHIALAEEADVILIAPATANIIGKIASGVSDDMLTTVVSAASSPVIMAPAMNERMFDNPITREKVSYLKEKGYFFVEPIVGDLACGKKGNGHLAEAESIVALTEKVLKSR